MPAGAGKICLATTILPENPVSRQAESARFRQRGRLACDPVITVTAPLRRVSDPEGKSCLLIQCGAPIRRCRAPSCLRGWCIRCCRSHVLRQDAAGAIAGPSRHRHAAGPYRLPHDVRDRLAAALAPFRNRDAAFALATFLGRFWSTPARLLTAFPIDRRELAEHAALGLTEARVRGAIRTLEEVGFLDRAVIAQKKRPGGRLS